eukprot:7229510-Pyramimonas_sp.AAC.1
MIVNVHMGHPRATIRETNPRMKNTSRDQNFRGSKGGYPTICCPTSDSWKMGKRVARPPARLAAAVQPPHCERQAE